MLQVSTVAPKTWKTLQSPVALKFGPTAGGSENYNPTTIGTVVSVGLIGPDGISINQNPEISLRASDQLYNNYDANLIFQSWQVTCAIDQYDVYNLALQLSFAQASVLGQSVVQLRGRDYFAGLKSMELEMDGPRISATTALISQRYQFWKVKVFQGGPIDIGRTVQSRLALLIHCLANDTDQVGQITFDTAYGSAPGYE